MNLVDPDLFKFAAYVAIFLLVFVAIRASAALSRRRSSDELRRRQLEDLQRQLGLPPGSVPRPGGHLQIPRAAVREADAARTAQGPAPAASPPRTLDLDLSASAFAPISDAEATRRQGARRLGLDEPLVRPAGPHPARPTTRARASSTTRWSATA